MVDKRPKKKYRQDRSETSATDKAGRADLTRACESAPSDAPDPTQVLVALIEAERTELMYVYSILRTLYQVLIYSDDADATTHADVARVCSMLIRESNERLEVLIRRYKAGEFRTAADAPRRAGRT